MWGTKDELIQYLLEQWERSERELLKLTVPKEMYSDELYGLLVTIGSIKGRLPDLK